MKLTHIYLTLPGYFCFTFFYYSSKEAEMLITPLFFYFLKNRETENSQQMRSAVNYSFLEYGESVPYI